MGAVFARGFLRLGHPVYPVTRKMHMDQVAAVVPDPALALIAVGEKHLASTLAAVPRGWESRICLLQNELLPDDWRGFSEATVISVWFEKKRGTDAKVILPSPAFGPQAQLLADALGAIDIPATVLNSPDELVFELVVKNLYILTTNIAGLRTGGTVAELWAEHRDFARAVAAEVLDVQEALSGRRFDRETLIQAMVHAFESDPGHRCMGRSATARLQRALDHGNRLGLTLPLMSELQAET